MKWLPVLLVALVATGCSASSTSSSTPVDREPAQVVKTGQVLRLEPRAPKHFSLWKFRAPVVRLHLHGNELIPPPDPSVLGWWGQPAGAAHGTTLLTGHTVHTGGGELDDLEMTPVGSVAHVSGVAYRVTSVKVISKPALARRAPTLFAQDGPARLVIVTCEGYNWSTGLYADNVVVVAEPENSVLPASE